MCFNTVKSDILINKFQHCIQKRLNAPKNANDGHENIGCVIFNPNKYCVLFHWYKSIQR